MDALTHAVVSGWSGERFEVETPAGPVTLVLERTAALPGHARLGGAFSVTFRGPPAPLLEQATYAFTRTGEEPIAIFIVPVGKNEAGIEYEAIFT